MDKNLYTDILEKMPLPCISEVYPFDHGFMQDNDPKHENACWVPDANP